MTLKKAGTENLGGQPLEFRLLGPFEAWRGAALLPPSIWGRQQTLKLLKLFLVERGKVYSIDQLIEAVYPEAQPGQAARNIQRRISELRRLLEPGLEKGTDSRFIVTHAQNNYSLSKSAPCQIDLEEFLSLSEAAQTALKDQRWPVALDGFERAIQLYRGQFLAEDLYEDWAQQPREHIRQQYLAAMLGLAECRARLGHIEKAIETCKSALRLEPTCEPLYKKLMLFQFVAGSSDQAEQSYQSCVKALAEQIGSQPSASTQALIGEIRAGQVKAAKDYQPTAQQTPTYLPAKLSKFIGRKRELEEIRELVLKSRLMTLTGAGGTGKTRLAIEVGSLCTARFPHGIWFIDLAPERTDGVIRAITNRLGLKERSRRSLLDLLIEELKEKNGLLIFDNCEHIVEPCAEAAKALLQNCPALSILATSRERLNLDGEAVYPIKPLSLPPDGLSEVDKLKQFDAIALFVERARAAHPRFALTDENSTAVAGICHQLDGIPLALELAAARVQMMPPQVFVEKLDQSFRHLAGGKRGELPHHQTLRAVIDWSFDLLNDPEKRLLNRLSVFRGGFPLEAAEAVCSDEKIRGDVLDGLSSLVQKSLLEIVESADQARFRLLETVRQYSAEKLSESGEQEQMQARHQRFFIELAEKAEPELTRADQARWLQRLTLDHDNLRAALHWSLEQREAETALRLSGALGRFWMIHGSLKEGRGWLRQSLEEGEHSPPKVVAKALLWTGVLARLLGNYDEAKQTLELSHNRAETAHDRIGEANALYELGIVSRFLGDHSTGWSLLDRSLQIYRELNERPSTARTLHQMAIIARQRRDFKSAMATTGESLQIARTLGDAQAVAMTLNTQAAVALDQLDFHAARHSFQECLTIFEQIDDKRGMAMALGNLGIVSLEEGDPVGARDRLLQSLGHFRELGDRQLIAYVLSVFARILLAEGSLPQAAKLQGAAMALLEDLNAPLQPDERTKFDAAATALKMSLGEESYQINMSAGRLLTLNQAIELVTGKQAR